MDEALSVLLSVHTLIFAGVCYLETLFIKKMSELLWPSLKKQAKEMDAAAMYKSRMALWWNEIILFFLPVFLGGLTGVLASMYPYPAEIKSLSGRMFFGMICGFLSAYMVRLLRKGLLGKVGAATEADLPAAEP